jgi:FkbM family methyltransferase
MPAMTSLVAAVRGRLTQAGLARLSPDSLAKLEMVVQSAQGKGWGTATVSEEVEAVRRLLGSDADSNPVVLDVGANVGKWTGAALVKLPAARVHAFEPSSAAFDLLKSAVGGHSRVTLHRFALGAHDMEATLFSDRAGSALASLTRRNFEHFDLPAMNFEERVQVRSLGAWLDEAGIDQVHVLKLDVEGHELDILRSVEDRLARFQVIQFEFGGANIDTRTYWQDFWYLLRGAGFRLARLGPRGLVDINNYREHDEVFVTTNFFAVR